MHKLWGGRFPTWEEFKKANNHGRVRVNKDLANKLAPSVGPKAHRNRMRFVAIMLATALWAAFLALPIAIALYFLIGISGRSIWEFRSRLLLDKGGKGRAVRCPALWSGCDEQFYLALINHGAFLFEPVQDQHQSPTRNVMSLGCDGKGLAERHQSPFVLNGHKAQILVVINCDGKRTNDKTTKKSCAKGKRFRRYSVSLLIP